MDDPKKRFPKTVEDVADSDSTNDGSAIAGTMANALAQLAQMQAETARILAEMRTGGNGNAAVIQQLLDQQERLLVKHRPENYEPTGISAFFTEAEKAQYGTKPELRCKTVWAGREVRGDVETVDEILLLNKLEPGDYRVTKADGTRVPFQVRHKRDLNDRLEEVNVWFPCKNEHKQNHGSMISYCSQALGVALPTLDELQGELARLRAELASARVGMGQAAVPA